MKNKWMLIGILFLVFSFIGCPGDSGDGTYQDKDNTDDPNLPSGTYVTVTFNANGGSAVEKQSILSGGKVTPVVTTRQGRYLEGWYGDVELTAKWNFETNTVSADITLYAKWLQTPANSFIVTFNTSKGSWVPDQAITSGSKITPVTITREGGYTFDNWYTGSMYSTKVDFDTYTVTSNVTVTARWNEPTLLPADEPKLSHPKGRYGNYYQIFPYSWATSSTATTGTRIGDFKGALARIDYINDSSTQAHKDAIAATGECTRSLHLDGIWFTPITTSTSWHKYDCDNNIELDPTFGTMDDFVAFTDACKERGIRVILDLMLNHSGPNHEWFTSARSSTTSPFRNYYTFSPTRINNDSWHSNTGTGFTGGFYEGVFSANMPDLNWNEPKLKEEFEKIVDFWLDKGATGFRLDAIKHIFEIHNSSGRTQDHTKNRELIRWFNNLCVSKRADIFLVGEVWSSQSEVLLYIGGPPGSGGGLMSCFNFDMRETVFNAANNGNANNFSTAVVNNYNQTKKVNPLGIDSVFLGNHDTTRFANRVGAASTTKIKMGGLVSLFAPGNPFVYYGEEIGAANGTGSGDDTYRSAMQWVSDPLGANMATGRATSWKGSNVAAQMEDPSSVLQFYIKTINLKNRYPQINWGEPSVISLSGNAVSAYKVNSRGEMRNLAVVHNHGSASQTVTIPGAKFLGGHILVTGTTEPTLNGTTLVIPGYSLAIIEL